MNTNPSYTLITGASSGIGREVAILLSQTRQLILHGRDEARLEETLAACKNPGQHLRWLHDLAQVDAIEASLLARLGQPAAAVEGFVHCAGMLGLLPIRQMTPSTSREILGVNFFSAVEIIRLLSKKTVNLGRLTGIVLVSSTASQFGAKGFSLYCASKGALDAFVRALAVELAPGVRVNSVLPGGIRTPMTESMYNNPDLAGLLEKDYPLGSGRTSDIAHAVEFLLSDNARWITGQQLVVDGGRTVNIGV
jgi:NAD(P)-dependent dehydrogenase (short-subunit alcohol dehydrogenase family)